MAGTSVRQAADSTREIVSRVVPLLRDGAIEDASSVLAAGFTFPELVAAGASMLRDAAIPTAIDAGREGPQYSVRVSAGVVQLVKQTPARAERAANREADRHPESQCYDINCPDHSHDRAFAKYGDHSALHEREAQRIVTSWSPKSRRRMVRVLAAADYRRLFRDGFPVMVTLTYPGEWLSVAGTKEQSYQHIRLLQLRWKRRWGKAPVGIWKLEFQRRGAPHYHLLVPHPHVTGEEFRAWLSRTWADIVGHTDPEQRARHLVAGTGVDMREGARMRDVKRVAVYFAGHSLKSKDGKEYQHIVPREWLVNGDGELTGRGAGRFWGVWGLERPYAGVPLTPRDFVTLRRLMRRYGRSQGYRILGSGAVVGGYLLVRDGAVFAELLARALALSHD